MGHQIHYSSYPEKVNKKSVQRFWDDYAAHEDWQEGCIGLSRDIRWIDHVCESEEDAEAYISIHDRGGYDQLAVKYKDTSGIPTTSATKERLIRQIESYRAKYAEYDKAHSVTNQKAILITCPFCNSKLAKAYLGKARGRVRANGCPVCEATDIRAEYVVKQLASFEEKIATWSTELKEEEKKLAKKVSNKAQIKWLVKVEYHV